MNPSQKIAFLGTGLMGAPMCHCLLRTGFNLTVWNRSAEKTRGLEASGATVAETPVDAVRDAEILITMLKDGLARLETVHKDTEEARRSQQVATDAAFDVRQRQIESFVTEAKKAYDANTDAIVAKIRQMDPQTGTAETRQSTDPMQASDAWQGGRLGESRTEPQAEYPSEARSGGLKGLCNWRDFEVKERATEVKREDFLLWRDKLGELL